MELCQTATTQAYPLLLCIFLCSIPIPLAATHLCPKECSGWESPLSCSLGPETAQGDFSSGLDFAGRDTDVNSGLRT